MRITLNKTSHTKKMNGYSKKNQTRKLSSKLRKVTLQLNKKNYYDRLGVANGASQNDIKKAYYKLSLMVHPDRNNLKSSNHFKRLSEAYECLSDECLKNNYDNQAQINSMNRDSDNGTHSEEGAYNRYEVPHPVAHFDSTLFFLDFEVFDLSLESKEYGMEAWDQMPQLNINGRFRSGLEQYIDTVLDIYGFDQFEDRSYLGMYVSVYVNATLLAVSCCSAKRKVCALIPLRLEQIERISVKYGYVNSWFKTPYKKSLLPVQPIKPTIQIIHALINYLRS